MLLKVLSAAAAVATAAAGLSGDAGKTCRLNRAFVFVKPNAVVPTAISLVINSLEDVGITIVEQGELGAKEIDEGRLIDSHYGAIASKVCVPCVLNAS